MGMNVAAISLPAGGSLREVKLAERLQWVLDHRDISASALSLKAGQSRAYVRKLMEREPVRPDFNALERIAEVAGVPPMWLIRGDGTPESTASPATTIDRTHADPPPPSSRAKALQRGIWEASHSVQGTEPEDYDAARTAGEESAQYLDTDGDVLGFAESLLRAAISLRRDGRVVNTAAILTRVAAGRTFGAEARHEQRNEAVDQVLDERAAAAGMVRGEKKEQGAKIGAEIARKQAKGRGA